MRISKYYLQATLYPFLITVAITAIFTVVENKHLSSQGLTQKTAITTAILSSILYCLLLNVLCLTIFLCKLEVVKNSLLLTVLSWFLLPLSPTLVIILKDFNYYMDIGLSSASGDLLYLTLLNGPLIIGLIRAFISYRKALSSLQQTDK
ncbi:hypothetical protein [Chitinophaga pinensis]|uniref:Uncharacterized protein n=1 Tax=Chitinophaga pinensis (strain ATCC 43595 / DSM 2588 / LMG 13176 / NBRC 15968 / NCIMB 11800 / UQM 2034) TaxID=485918 RepID=A0A979G3P2_CHIPD|nr:hypothetical protein [Chitinophaga pinensis]ACU60342.1 hypothetical protein Cpin_2863 [Chitinophaga pinensis DSM 2588]